LQAFQLPLGDQLVEGPVQAPVVDDTPRGSDVVQPASSTNEAPASAPSERAIETVPAGAPQASVDSAPGVGVGWGAPGAGVGGAAPEASVGDVPSAGVGLGTGVLPGLSQLLAMVLAVSSAFAAWRSRVRQP
jgi:hypothetical protein